jgi:uncharacterized membrane protein
MEERFWELDALRGLAVVGMVVFHAAFDLSYFRGFPFDVTNGFWWLLARAVATTFVLVSGCVLAISYGKVANGGIRTAFDKIFPRSLRIFALALVVTAATFLFLSGNGTIWFGVLHFMAVGSLITLLFMGLGWPQLIWTGIVMVAAGFLLESVTVQTPLLLWLGLRPAGFYTFDYFPLLPWLGVLLFGAAIGKRWYGSGVRGFQLPIGENGLTRALAFVGRHSLAIYFIHQPLLIGAILLA